MGSPSRLDPIPLRCQAGFRAQELGFEFGFEFGFGTVPSGAANLPRTKNPLFQIPEEGLEPTRPCGQRILSAADNFFRVMVAPRLCDFSESGAVRWER